MEDNAKVARATLWYTISNILLRGVSLITAPIFTRMLTTSDYGIASNFTSWVSIILCFTTLSLPTAALRGRIGYKEKYKDFLSSIQTLGMLWTGFCCIVMFFSLDLLSDFMELDKVCIIVMLFYLLVYPSLLYAQVDYRFDYKYKENVAISVINTTGTVFCSMGLILLWSNQRYLGRIIGTILPTIIMGTWFAVKIYRQGSSFIDINYWKYALRLSLPMIPHSLAMIILGQIDRIMIIRYCGNSQAGIYSFGYSYAVLISVVTNALNDAVQPQMYEMLENNESKKLASLSYKMIMLGVMVSVILIGVGPEALKILGTDDYFEARWMIFPVLMGTLMQYIYQFFGVIEIYCEKTAYMAIGSCGAAIVNYILNMLLIPRMGYVIAAYTTLISYGLLMLFHFIMSRIAYKKEVFRIMPILLITVISLAIGMVLMRLYDNSWLARYGVLLLIVSVFYVALRREIAELIKMVVSKGK